MTGRCGQCGARVVLAMTKSGKAVAVDAWPNPGGTVLLDRGTLPPTALPLQPGERAPSGQKRYAPHSATCGAR